ncbi:LacI family DNA-binding transcriptional regulator [Sphingomonas sp.]|uniref:LacI family DNA-binding transcriptional regulator n=1 Tax=Sphingomonas sp. TaxID=28214 RepID=UPI003B0027CC
MTATIKDVALHAGVSAKTVSRVMNREVHVREAVRERVMRAVAELGYRPNAFARSLSSARSYLIGLFFDDPTSGYAVAMQRGALARCRESHYHLVVERLDCAAPDWREELAGSVGALRLDGAILTPPLSQTRAILEVLETAGVPFVCVSPDPMMVLRCGVVDFDEIRAAFEMTERLIALGHRDIGFIEGDPTHASTRARRSGFVNAMAAAGLSIADGRIQPGDFSFRAGLAAGEALLTVGLPPSAIFASNDDMALGVSVAALKQGLDVPGRLSIAGFDDAPSSRIAWPPITTVRQPVEEMGAAAVDMLIDPIGLRNDVPAPHRTRLTFELVERESTSLAAI